MTGRANILPPGKLPGAVLAQLLQRHVVRDERVLIGPGPGRDAAAVQFGDSALVVKTDPITFPTDRPAHHLIHVNANDIACQGATPRWLLVTALLPHGSTTAETATSLFADLNEVASGVGVEVIGGHTEITIGLDRPILVGTMLGEAPVSGLVDPARAEPGDRVLMTRTAGIEGTAILAHELRPLLESRGVSAHVLDAAVAMIDEPGISIVNEAAALAGASVVRAMHDPTEGGIVTAVRELAIAADCGVIISRDAIAVAPETLSIAGALDVDPIGLLASGSLLAAVPRNWLARAEQVLDDAKVPYVWIGKLTPVETGMRMRTGTTDVPLPEFAVDEVARILAG